MTIRLELRRPVALLWLDRPEQRNAISLDLVDSLVTHLQALEEDDDVRSVVLAGTGNTFCSGVDINEARTVESPAEAMHYIQRVRRGFEAVYLSPMPTIAAITGLALGGGFELAVSCDFRLASPDAQIGLPEVKIGALPAGGGMSKLLQLVGLATATELVLTAESIDGERAAQLGLVNSTHPDPVEASIGLAKRLSEYSPAVMAMAKRSLHGASAAAFGPGYEMELLSTAAVFGFADRTEGMNAFLEKRVPRFSGK